MSDLKCTRHSTPSRNCKACLNFMLDRINARYDRLLKHTRSEASAVLEQLGEHLTEEEQRAMSGTLLKLGGMITYDGGDGL